MKIRTLISRLGKYNPNQTVLIGHRERDGRGTLTDVASICENGDAVQLDTSEIVDARRGRLEVSDLEHHLALVYAAATRVLAEGVEAKGPELRLALDSLHPMLSKACRERAQAASTLAATAPRGTQAGVDYPAPPYDIDSADGIAMAVAHLVQQAQATGACSSYGVYLLLNAAVTLGGLTDKDADDTVGPGEFYSALAVVLDEAARRLPRRTHRDVAPDCGREEPN